MAGWEDDIYEQAKEWERINKREEEDRLDRLWEKGRAERNARSYEEERRKNEGKNQYLAGPVSKRNHATKARRGIEYPIRPIRVYSSQEAWFPWYGHHWVEIDSNYEGGITLKGFTPATTDEHKKWVSQSQSATLYLEEEEEVFNLLSSRKRGEKNKESLECKEGWIVIGDHKGNLFLEIIEDNKRGRIVCIFSESREKEIYEYLSERNNIRTTFLKELAEKEKKEQEEQNRIDRNKAVLLNAYAPLFYHQRKF